jgi:hypothetical protein
VRGRRIVPLGLALLLLATGACSSDDDDGGGGTDAAATTATTTTTKETGSSTTTTTTPPSRFESARFRIPFTVDVPGGWTAVERNDEVAQLWRLCSCPHEGEEHGEISLDLSLTDASPKAAAEQLATAPQLDAPVVEPWSEGDLLGFHFVGRRNGRTEVEFPATGYRTESVGDPFDVIVVDTGRGSVVVFVDPHEAKGADADEFRATAAKILGSLRFSG